MSDAADDIEALRVLVERARNVSHRDAKADLILRAYWLGQGKSHSEVLDFRNRTERTNLKLVTNKEGRSNG